MPRRPPGDGGTRLPLVPPGDELLVVDHGWFRDHDHMVTVQALHHLRLLSFVFGREVRHLGSPLPVNFTPYAVHRAQLFLTSFATLRMSSAANWLTWTSVPTSRSASKALGLGPGQGRAWRRRRGCDHPVSSHLTLTNAPWWIASPGRRGGRTRSPTRSLIQSTAGCSPVDTHSLALRFLVAPSPSGDLLLSAKHLFVEDNR